MPRAPITLSDDQVREVETLAALLNQEQIADYLGISRTTFQQIMKRDEEVAVRYKRGKSKAIAHVANCLLQKARAGDTTSSIFYLKTQAGWHETARLEHKDPARETLAQLMKRISNQSSPDESQALGDDRGEDAGGATDRLPPPGPEA